MGAARVLLSVGRLSEATQPMVPQSLRPPPGTPPTRADRHLRAWARIGCRSMGLRESVDQLRSARERNRRRREWVRERHRGGPGFKAAVAADTDQALRSRGEHPGSPWDAASWWSSRSACPVPPTRSWPSCCTAAGQRCSAAVSRSSAGVPCAVDGHQFHVHRRPGRHPAWPVPATRPGRGRWDHDDRGAHDDRPVRHHRAPGRELHRSDGRRSSAHRYRFPRHRTAVGGE